MKPRELGSRTLLAFSSPAFAISALSVGLTVYLPTYFAQTLKLDIAAVGTIFMAIRLIDTAIDPVLGAMMDATRTRWGSYAPWLAMSAPVLVLSVIMLFFAQPGASLTYVCLWLLFAFVGYSMIVLSHLAWTANLTTRFGARNRIFAWWQVFGSAGQLAVLSTPALIAMLTNGDAQASVNSIGWVLVVLVPVCIAAALISGPKDAVPVADESEREGFGDILLMLRQPGIFRLLFVDLLLGLTIGILSTCALFYYTGPLGFERGTAGAILTTSYVAALFGSPILARLSGKLGRARALAVGALLMAGAQGSFLLVPSGNLPLAILAATAGGLFMPTVFLPRAIMADNADAERARSGKDRTGLLFSLLNGTMKLAIGLSVGLVFVLLGQLGFDPAKPGAAESAFALRAIMALLPMVPLTIVAACMWRYHTAGKIPASDAVAVTA